MLDLLFAYDLLKARALLVPDGAEALSKDRRVIDAEPGVMAARAALVRGARRMLAGTLELLGIDALEEM